MSKSWEKDINMKAFVHDAKVSGTYARDLNEKENTPLSYNQWDNSDEVWGKGPLIVVTDMNGF